MDSNHNLGDRKDFWNTQCNPITGYRVPSNYHNTFRTQSPVAHKLQAEYRFIS